MLYPSIPHDEGLKVSHKNYNKFIDKNVPTEDITKMTEFVLKNSLFELNSKFYKQISGIAIDTKFSLPYAFIFIDYIEIEMLKSQHLKPWLWKRFIDYFFLFGQIQRKILIGF